MNPPKAKLMPITQIGQPVLRKVAKPIRKMSAAALVQLVQDMYVTMKRAQGVGIAAPQVGLGLRLFIVAPVPNPRYPKAPRLPPVAMINPRLLEHSKETVKGYEGCLSVPGLRGPVSRYTWVKIDYSDLQGKRVTLKLSGFVARIFQHEFDHINGMVYIDRVVDTRTFMTDQEYHRRAVAAANRRPAS